MPDIRYTDHLKLRLKIRNFPEDYPKLIYQNPEKKFFDQIERNKIAIKRLKYNNKLREIMIAYTEENGEIDIVTIHPISEEKISNRIISGRWIKNE